MEPAGAAPPASAGDAKRNAAASKARAKAFTQKKCAAEPQFAALLARHARISDEELQSFIESDAATVGEHDDAIRRLIKHNKRFREDRLQQVGASSAAGSSAASAAAPEVAEEPAAGPGAEAQLKHAPKRHHSSRLKVGQAVYVYDPLGRDRRRAVNVITKLDLAPAKSHERSEGASCAAVLSLADGTRRVVPAWFLTGIASEFAQEVNDHLCDPGTSPCARCESLARGVHLSMRGGTSDTFDNAFDNAWYRNAQGARVPPPPQWARDFARRHATELTARGM
jgi:hypothetical protein